MSVGIGEFGQALIEELNEWASTELKEAANESFEETAKEAAKMLKSSGQPYNDITGAYRKDWTSGLRNGRTSQISGLKRFSVYNKENYQLTHLLEYGHQSRNGGRVREFSHIATVNEQVGEMAAIKLERKLGG